MKQGDQALGRHTDAATEAALFRRLASGDRRARDELVDRFDGLASWTVARLPTRADPEELVQEARLGLLEAVERFDYGRRCRFATYATAVIRGRLTACLRQDYRDRNPPRDLGQDQRDEDDWKAYWT